MNLTKLAPLFIFIVASAMFLFLSPTKALADNLCWNGASGADFGTASNWYDVTTSSTAAAPPGSSDTAYFDPGGSTCSTHGTNNNANIAAGATINISGINITSNYTATLTQTTTATVTVGSSGYTQAGGTYTGGSGSITFNGNFLLSNGSFTSTSGTLSASANWEINSGTFVHNNGTLNLSGSTITINGNINVYNLTISSPCGYQTHTISSGSLTVLNNLLLSSTDNGNCSDTLNGPGLIYAQGNINTSIGGAMGNALITIDGTGSQSLNGDGVSSDGNNLPSITINKPSGTLTITNTIQIYANWTYDAGIVNPGTSTIIFSVFNASPILTGTLTLNNVVFFNAGSCNSATVSSGTIITILGTLSSSGRANCGGPSPISLNGPGTLVIQGNINELNNGMGFTGNIAITLSGTNSQTLDLSSSGNFSSGTFTINKPSGVVTLLSPLNLSGSSQALILSSGTLSNGTNSLTVNGMLTVGGILSQGSGTVNAGTFYVTSDGVWNNTSNGAVTVGSGGVKNYGQVNLGTLQSCSNTSSGSYASVTSSSSGTARTWTGSGIFNLYNVSVSDQNESPDRGRVVAFKSTLTSNSNFIFYSTCPKDASLYWKFDDGQGTSVNDSAITKDVSGGDSGTLGGSTLPTWQTADECVSSKCLYFDGVSSKVTASKTVNNVQTVSVWVRPVSVSSGTIVDLDGGTHTITYSSGTISANGFSSPTIYINGQVSSTLTANQWQLVTVTTSTAFNTSSSFTLATNGTTYFNGFLDEFKLYSYPRTQGQTQTDALIRSSIKGSGTVLGASSTDALNKGLVGYWKMDESSWNGTSGEVKDATGNVTTCKAVNGATTTTGKFGNAGSFGSTKYVDCGTTPSALNSMPANTFAAWVYTTSSSTNQFIMGKMDTGSDTGDKFIYITNSGTVRAYAAMDGGGSSDYTTSNTISTNTWHFIAYTFDINGDKKIHIYIDGVEASYSVQDPGNGTIITDDSSEHLVIGNSTVGDLPVSGEVDEARVYNRALTPNEIQQLYNSAPGPVGYWKFDEGKWTGVTDEVKDSSGNGTNCTALNGASTVPGKFGNAGSFNGTKMVDCGIDPAILHGWGNTTYSAWVYSISTPLAENYVFSKTNSGFEYGRISLTSSGQIIGEQDMSGTNASAVSSTTVSKNTWHYITYTFDNSTSKVRIFLDGVEVSYSAQTTGTGSVDGDLVGSGASTNGIHLILGNVLASGYPLSGYMDDFKIYNYTRTQKQILEDMNASHPTGGSPIGTEVGYWKFDEGYGTTAHNSGSAGSIDNATLSGSSLPTWVPGGKFGRAVDFQSSNSYITVGNDTSLQITSNLTLSAWVFLDTSASDQDILAKDGASGQYGYRLYVNSNGKLVMEVSGDGTSTTTATGNTSLSFLTWYHVVGVYVPGVSLTVYVNGVQDGQNTTSIPTSIHNSTANLEIGSQNGDTANQMSLGAIDEAKIYPSSLTQQEVLIDMNHNSSEVLGALSDPTGFSQVNSVAAQYCIPGDSSTCSAPVGEWNFEEGTGTSVNDTSGKGNNGTWGGTLGKQWTVGKVGSAGNFNGTDNFVNMGNVLNQTGSYTIEAWVYLTGGSGQRIILDKGGNNRLKVDGTGLVELTNGASGVKGATVLSTNTWHYLVGTYNSSTTTGIVYIDGVQDGINTSQTAPSSNSVNLHIGNEGNFNSSYWPGKIDQVRMFSYARTPAQVDWDYNRGAPVGYWKMDECQGTTINDSSGNGNTGTLTVGGSGTQYTPGNCNTSNSAAAWSNGATGKYNSSINLDGTDDYIDTKNFMDNPSNITVAAWIKTSFSGSTYETIVSKISNLFSSPGWDLYLNCNNGPHKCYPTLLVQTDGSDFLQKFENAIVNDGEWHFIVISKDNSNNFIGYLDGAQIPLVDLDSSGTLTTSSNTYDVQIGQESDGNYRFNGQLDDVRVYNYALTASQVKNLYNQGSALRYGPSTGSP